MNISASRCSPVCCRRYDPSKPLDSLKTQNFYIGGSAIQQARATRAIPRDVLLHRTNRRRL